MVAAIAYAMGPGGTPGAGGGGWQGFVPIILMFAIFYFILILPQQRRARSHKEMLSNLKKDDQVVTTGGLYGKVTGLTDTVVTLEIARDVRVKVQRSQIAAREATGGSEKGG